MRSGSILLARYFEWEDDLLHRGGGGAELGVEVVVEEGELLGPGIQTMAGLGEPVEFAGVGEVEDGFALLAKSFHERLGLGGGHLWIVFAMHDEEWCADL